MTEAERKRAAALEAAGGSTLVVSAPANVRWLVAAEVDAAVIAACRPDRAHGELFEVLTGAYERLGFPDEWRLHHQGGLTGYKGREVFAVRGEPTPLPPAGAVAWNPSVTGGGKSEDTVLVTAAGHEVLTHTPELAELDTAAGLRRAAITEL